MAIKIRSDKYRSKEEALHDFVNQGLWPLSAESNEGPIEEPHWHPWDTHAFLVSGEYEAVDPADGSVTTVKAGDYMFVPARTLHGGRVTKKATFVGALTKPTNSAEKLRYTADEL